MKIHRVKDFVDICEGRHAISSPHKVEAPDELWRAIIEQQPNLRIDVARNKTIGERIIRVLADDEDEHVRWTIATKRSAPQDVLRKLAHDIEPTVRKRVALNPKVPESILIELLDDDWDVVCEIAADKLKKLKEEDDSST